jgi:hypothetical protein
MAFFLIQSLGKSMGSDINAGESLKILRWCARVSERAREREIGDQTSDIREIRERAPALWSPAGHRGRIRRARSSAQPLLHRYGGPQA